MYHIVTGVNNRVYRMSFKNVTWWGIFENRNDANGYCKFLNTITTGNSYTVKWFDEIKTK